MIETLSKVFSSLLILQLGFVLPVGFLHSYFERKIGADLQARVGPNRVGPLGLFQGIADQLKLLQKVSPELKTPQLALWPALQLAALHAAMVTVPIAPHLLMTITGLSILLPLWCILMVSVCSLLLGVNSREFTGWLAGLRSAFQAISGFLPAMISLISVGLSAGGFQWSNLLSPHDSSMGTWLMFREPFLFVSFLIFLASGMVILSLPPFDSTASGPDLRGGLGTLFSGRRSSLSVIIKFYGVLVWCVLTVGLFMGGWALPGFLSSVLVAVLGEGAANTFAYQAIQVFLVGLKTLSLMMVLGVVGRVMPRIRFDQVADFSWRALGPISLVCLMGSALLKAGGISP